ncbi:hypothetical protein TWF506_009001 [Arthrobotrys conoides]|uniref:Uncharacterized protein n=1 Tax=Arthrobotrys conoides TaxID=74498 RepID=A0AAN8RWR9_9PEZI
MLALSKPDFNQEREPANELLEPGNREFKDLVKSRAPLGYKLVKKFASTPSFESEDSEGLARGRSAYGTVPPLAPPLMATDMSYFLGPDSEGLPPHRIESIRYPTPGLADGAFNLPKNLSGLSGLIWGRVGSNHAIWWRNSGAASVTDRDEVREAVMSFREMKEKEPIKFQQLIYHIEEQSLPVGFKFTQPRAPQHIEKVIDPELDDDPEFVSERNSKLNIIHLLLQLLIWREDARRLGRESSISSTILETEDSESLTTVNFDHNRASFSLHNRNNDASEEKQSAAETKTPAKEITSSENLPKSGHRSLGQGAGRRRDTEQDNNTDDDEGRPPNKRRKKESAKALSGQLACPFAKAEPAVYLRCLTIGRKDLSGVKEHLRRNHFHKSTPPGLLIARSWNEMFSFCCPLWAPRPYPSPYVDVTEILFNVVRWNNTPSGTRQEDILVDYQRANSLQGQIVNVAGLVTIIPEVGRVGSPGQSQTQTASVVGLDKVTTDASRDPESREIDTTSNNDNIPGTSFDPDSATQLGECSFDIVGPGTSFALGQYIGEGPNQWNEITGISDTLSAAVARMAEPHVTWPLSETQLADPEYSNFLETEFGIIMSLPPEERYSRVLSSIDLNGIFDPLTEFTTPLVAPMPSTLSSTTFPHPQQVVCEAQTRIPFQPVSIVFPEAPVCPSGFGSSDSSSNATTCTVPPSPRLQPIQPSTEIDILDSGDYHLLVSRRPINPNSAEGQGYKRYRFEGFKEFRENFESWLKSEFFDPIFDWTTMEFCNDHRGARLTSVEEIIDDLDGSFTHYRSSKASLYLVMKDKGKQRAT